jgi:hypothetical protein
MANSEHVEILKEGVQAWNQWREVNPGVRPDLDGVGLVRERCALPLVVGVETKTGGRRPPLLLRTSDPAFRRPRFSGTYSRDLRALLQRDQQASAARANIQERLTGRGHRRD